MTQQQRIGRTATKVAGDGEGNIEITYHATKVVIFNEELITLNSGGYYSNTTKTRMNQASNTFRLKFQVFQNKHEWYVDFSGKTYPYCDKMRLDRKSGDVFKYVRNGQEVEIVQPIAK